MPDELNPYVAPRVSEPAQNEADEWIQPELPDIAVAQRGIALCTNFLGVCAALYAVMIGAAAWFTLGNLYMLLALIPFAASCVTAYQLFMIAASVSAFARNPSVSNLERVTTTHISFSLFSSVIMTLFLLGHLYLVARQLTGY